MEHPPSNGTAADAPFVVIGLGASAGGLQALEAFFGGLPKTDGAAFVVVIHLAPDRESEMADVLGRSVPIPVVQVMERVRVERGHIYVIPPNRNLVMEDGHLRLAPLENERRYRRPIDHFFRTLAAAYGDHAVAVVLSGTGHNGTVGVRAIKEAGGLVLAQDPDEAGYDEMPRSAITSGVVDCTATAAGLAAEAIAYSERLHRVHLPADEPSGLAHDDVRAVQRVLAQLRARTGHDFSHYKRSTVLRRLERRLHVVGADTLDDYASRLRADGGEAHELLQDLLISVTSFFRDPAAFEALEMEVVPKLFEGKGQGDEVRVWVAGCATGEEAYSVAMLLAEHAAALDEPPAVQVFGTDLSEAAIRTAREGVYPESIEADVSPERLRRFFRHDAHGYRVREALRGTILFTPHNLLRDPPFSRVGLVTCRNVLIYFQRVLQQRALDLFHYALVPGGTLFLGTSETAEAVSEAFHTVDKPNRIYQCHPVRETAAVPALARAVRSRLARPAALPPGGDGEAPDVPASFADLHEWMRAEAAPPSVLVAENNDVVHLSEGAGAFFEVSPGEPTRNVLLLVRPELRVAVQTALFQSGRQAEPVATGATRLDVGGAPALVSLRVRRASETGLVQILFDAAPAPPEPAGEEAPADDHTAALADELTQTREQLQLSIEEFETNREELQAQNEELQSTNEELRSTAEELETSKEEAQSMAEELLTVNDEMKAGIEDLARAKGDIENLILSTEIATLFLDRQLRIKWFTPQIRSLFHVLSADVGRPLGDLAQKFGDTRLVEDAEAVLERLQVTEREVRDDGGRWHLVGVRPYRTADDRIDGVVVTFVDITERRRSEEALRESATRLRSVYDGTRTSFALVALDGTLIEVNHAGLSFFGGARADAVGRPLWETPWLAPTPGAPAYVRAALQRATAGEFVRDEVEVVRPSGETAVFDLSFTPTLGDAGAVMLVVVEGRDVTDRARTQAALSESEARYRTLFDSIDEGFAICELVRDDTGRVVDSRYLELNPAFEALTGLAHGEVEGRCVRELFPGVEDEWLDTYTRVVETGEPVRFEQHLEALGQRFEVYAFPLGGDRFAGLFTDVTARRRAEAALQASADRALFRTTLADALRPLSDAAHVQAKAARVLGEHLGASRVHYAEFEADGEHATVAEHYTAGVPERAGRYRMADYATLHAEAKAGRTFVVPDVQADDRLSAPERETFGALPVSALVVVPLVRDGTLKALLAVHHDVPHAWEAEEITLVEETAERTWAATERVHTETALRASEAKYRTLFESIDEGFALCEMLDTPDGEPPDYCFLDVNPAFFAMSKLPADTVGRSAREVMPAIEAHWLDTYDRVIRTREPVRIENYVQDLGRWFDVYVAPVEAPELRRFVIIFTDVTERRQAETEIRALNETLEGRVSVKTKQVRRLAARLAVAEQDERQRIAHLLHDDLQQQLYGLSMVLALLQRAPEPEAATALATRASSILDEAVAMSRSLATELSPAILQASRLEEVLAWTAAAEREKHGLDISVEVAGDPCITDPAMRILLYQSLREVLLNAVKHSGQTRVRLVASAEPDADGGTLAVVRIEDDGVGFDGSSAAEPGDGFGLFSVRERLALVGGHFAIESAPGEGTRVTLSVPSGAPAPESP